MHIPGGGGKVPDSGKSKDEDPETEVREVLRFLSCVLVTGTKAGGGRLEGAPLHWVKRGAMQVID